MHRNLLMLLLSVATTLLVASTQAQAQARQPGDPWWFEVEAIFFKRNVEISQLTERFDSSPDAFSPKEHASFIRDFLKPDISNIRGALPVCGTTQVIELPLQTAPGPALSDSLIAGDLDSYYDELKLRSIQNDANSLDNALTLLDTLIADSDEIVPVSTDDILLIAPDDIGALKDVAPIHPVSALLKASETLPNYFVPTELDCQWQTEAQIAFDETQIAWRNDISLTRVPDILDGVERPFSKTAYVLPSTELQLGDLYRRISRHRDMTPLLHMAWRQNVATGRDNAPFYHVFAGARIKADDKTDINERQPNNTEFSTPIEMMEYVLSNDFESVEKSENSEEAKAPDWPIDGLLKIFIEYIGGTPYLHVDSKFDIAVPNGVILNERAESETYEPVFDIVHFSQLRRVISTEIHYFDHPAFGFVIQIRRYQRPEKPEETSEDFPDS